MINLTVARSLNTHTGTLILHHNSILQRTHVENEVKVIFFALKIRTQDDMSKRVNVYL
jgi:DNA-binding NarL/FixJ family response regulator